MKLIFLAFIAWEIRQASSHGMIMDPPNRSSMWRFGYPTPENYDDNELFCGGYMAFENNGAKCGVCGDNWADSTPRENEAGGKYGLGIVTRRYSKGQLIDSEILLTANHKGHFEFRLCPVPDRTKEVTQECLDQTRLQVMDDQGRLQDRYVISTSDKMTQLFAKIQLPQDLTCTHCVLQWTYIAANSWGICNNGTEAIGCGKQETFVNCADIAIISNDGSRPPSTQTPPKNMVLVRDNKSGEYIPLVVRSQVCQAHGTYKDQPGMDNWCQENCMRYPPNCPEDKCKCLENCEPQGAFKEVEGAELYCNMNCFVYPQRNCSVERCKCE